MSALKKSDLNQGVNKSPHPENNKKETLDLIQKINQRLLSEPKLVKKAATILEFWINSKIK